MTAFLAALAPIALFVAALAGARRPGMRPTGVLRIAGAASLFAMAVALGIAVAVALWGPMTSPLIGAHGLGLQLRLDAVSAVMAVLVGFVGWVVLRYARNYLDGDARQGAFTGGLALTLGAVLLLVLSGNVVQLVLAWILTGLSLHRLLLFYADRPVARLAARKMFLYGRIGDLFLIAAAAAMVGAFGTGEIAAMAEILRAGETPQGVGLAAVCLAIAALLMSAQFPAHGWLTEVMDAPTPVSALLHAGVINAGGFVMVRFADVILASLPAMQILALVGGATAALASLAALAQTSVKLGLAWSTIAQMGFMLLQCGLGAFSAALLHIVAHSLYKAHGFLGAGAVIDAVRAKLGHRLRPPKLSDMVLTLGIAAVAVVGTGWAFGVTLDSKPALVVLGAVMILGLAHVMAVSLGQPGGRVLLARTALASFGLAALYFTLQLGAEAVLAGAVPPVGQAAFGTQVVMALMVALFAAVAVVQIQMPGAQAAGRWRAFGVHLRNGFYVTAIVNRVLAPKFTA